MAKRRQTHGPSPKTALPLQPPLPGLAADQPAAKSQRRAARAEPRQGAVPKPKIDNTTGVLWPTPKRPKR